MYNDIVLSSIIYNINVRLKNYLNIDGVWFRSICNSCGNLLKGTYSDLCRDCFKSSIKGQVRVTHNKPHSEATKQRLSIVKQKAILTYSGLHIWLRREYGSADTCENRLCKRKAKRFTWANVSGLYIKDRNQFVQLCYSCHIGFDKWGHEVEL